MYKNYYRKLDNSINPKQKLKTKKIVNPEEGRSENVVIL